MSQGTKFIREIDAIKQTIELRYAKEFTRLYKRIGNDLINLLQTNQSINFQEAFKNYAPDYTYLFRNVFNDVKIKLGYGIRTKLNFNLANQVLLKSVAVNEAEQEKINDIFDNKYTLLLNNKTEELVGNEFIQSEANYFENLYTKSQNEYTNFIESQRKEQAVLGAELLTLLFVNSPSKAEKERIRYLQKKTDALNENITNITQKHNKAVLEYFKNNLEDKIPTRSQGNSEYAVGQASSEVRELEYQSIKESSAKTTAGVAIIALIKKVWIHYSLSNPRKAHVALSGTSADLSGNFYVNGYYAPKPRDLSLPPSETVHCRCEVEYF